MGGDGSEVAQPAHTMTLWVLAEGMRLLGCVSPGMWAVGIG